MASWPSAAEVAVPRRARTPVAPRVRPGARTAGGVAWIVVVAAVLAGVVALNVAVLGLNVELDRLGRERSELRARKALLESRLSSTAARNETFARTRLGLVPAEPQYVGLPPRRK